MRRCSRRGFAATAKRVLLSLTVGAWGLILPARAVTLRDLVADPLLVGSVYHRPVTDQVDAAGAVGINRKGAQPWFIEEQRAGADFVQRGLAVGQSDWIATGWRILDWGIARQAADGSFPGTGDPFHSASFFVEALARALLLESAAQTPVRVAALRRAAEWLVRPDVTKRGEAHNRPYAHRRWILAAALALTARVTGEETFMAAARSYACDGLGLQTAEGINPEKDGADVGYQMVGVVMAARYAAVDHDSDIRRAVIAMIERAARWQAARIRPDGAVDTTGSTRIGMEAARDGQVKGVPYLTVVEGLVYAARLTGDVLFRDVAERVARRRWRPW
jgi:hypothetical protein